jgi:protein TonB
VAAEAPVTPPVFDAAYLDNPAPRYPPAAARLRESGRVLLLVSVSASGLPERVELARSSGSPRLDQAALETVRRWRFVPARQGDRSVAAQVTVPLVFRLEE